jgi:hypothetical protein
VGLNVPRVTRDGLLLAAGLVLLTYEAIGFDGPPRVPLLVIYAGMLGLPAVLRIDEARRRNGNGGG